MPTAVKTRKSSYRTLLLKKRQELLSSVKREPTALTTSVQTPDPVEFAVQSLEQDVSTTALELRSRTLKDIERSLRQLAAGTYGVCEGCGEEISPNRLKALPWAHYCLTCQELRSKN